MSFNFLIIRRIIYKKLSFFLIEGATFCFTILY